MHPQAWLQWRPEYKTNASFVATLKGTTSTGQNITRFTNVRFTFDLGTPSKWKGVCMNFNGDTDENVKETYENVKETYENVKETYENVKETYENVKETYENVKETYENVKETYENVKETYENVKETYENVKETMKM